MAKPATTPVPAKRGEPIAVVVREMPADDHLTDWVNIGMSAGVGLTAALLGAVIGNHLTRKTALEAKQRDDDEKLRFLSFAMRHKLMKIYSGLNAIKTALAPAYDEVAARRARGEVAHVSFLARGAGHRLYSVTFSEEELFRTARLAGPDFINPIMLLDEHYNSKIELVERYGRERETLEKAIRGPVAEDGTREIKWTKHDYEQHQPMLAGLDHLLDLITATLDEDRGRALRGVERL